MRIYHRDPGVKSFSHDGKTFEIGRDGHFNVPDTAGHAALGHGFKQGEAEDDQPDDVIPNREPCAACLPLFSGASAEIERVESLLREQRADADRMRKEPDVLRDQLAKAQAEIARLEPLSIPSALLTEARAKISSLETQVAALTKAKVK